MSITYTDTPPERCPFATLLDSTGWFRDAPLSLEQLDQALAVPSWNTWWRVVRKPALAASSSSPRAIEPVSTNVTAS